MTLEEQDSEDDSSESEAEGQEEPEPVIHIFGEAGQVQSSAAESRVLMRRPSAVAHYRAMRLVCALCESCRLEIE